MACLSLVGLHLAPGCSGGGGSADGGGEVDAGDAEGDAAGDSFDASAARAVLVAVPETARFTLPNLSAEAFVVRTEASVPHVYAANRADLGRVLGFVLGRDRFFIMDLQRRLALGTISELLGELGLSSDRESRLTGMTRVADQMLAALDPDDGAYLDAVAEGINAYIAAVAAGSQPLPSELELAGPLLGTEDVASLMKPFDRRSLVAMMAVIVFETTFDGSDVARTAHDARLEAGFDGVVDEALRKAGARQDIWERLEPPFAFASAAGFGLDRDGVSTQVAPAAARPTVSAQGRRPKAPLALLERTGAALAKLTARLGKRSAENFGSNTWAVAGSSTPDGAALLAGDGHLQLDVPTLMYQVGIDTRVLGGGDIHQTGLMITGIPVMGVGTNGRVAWSQVNPVIDTTDWYAEELVLDAAGLPAATRFEGAERAVVAKVEQHQVADIPLLQSVGRTDEWTRYETFDGRMLTAVEGRALAAEEEPGDGEAVVETLTGRVVPGDADGDGVVSAVSFDYTAFDATYIHASFEMARAESVDAYRDATRGLIGNALYSAAADADGNILYTSYQAVPCRGYLDREASGRWVAGADPTELLDGTRYRGFTVPSAADGTVDEAPGKTDPYRCVVPFDETPQSINPPQGFVVNANNQPAPVQNDGTLWDDRWYVGGPWSSVRADTIARRLEAAIAADNATVAEMASIQADNRSRTAELFVPLLLESVERAADAGAEARLAALYSGQSAAIDEAVGRLSAWQGRGYRAASGGPDLLRVPGRDGARGRRGCDDFQRVAAAAGARCARRRARVRAGGLQRQPRAGVGGASLLAWPRGGQPGRAGVVEGRDRRVGLLRQGGNARDRGLRRGGRGRARRRARVVGWSAWPGAGDGRLRDGRHEPVAVGLAASGALRVDLGQPAPGRRGARLHHRPVRHLHGHAAAGRRAHGRRPAGGAALVSARRRQLQRGRGQPRVQRHRLHLRRRAGDADGHRAQGRARVGTEHHRGRAVGPGRLALLRRSGREVAGKPDDSDPLSRGRRRRGGDGARGLCRAVGATGRGWGRGPRRSCASHHGRAPDLLLSARAMVCCAARCLREATLSGARSSMTRRAAGFGTVRARRGTRTGCCASRGCGRAG